MILLRTLVVDASVVVKWILQEPGRAAAARLLDQYEAEQVDLISPTLLMQEVVSGLCKRYRLRELTAKQVEDAVAYLELRRPLGVSDSSLQHEALLLALRHQLSYWDATYLALAVRHKCDLITADRRFYRATASKFPFVQLLQ